MYSVTQRFKDAVKASEKEPIARLVVSRGDEEVEFDQIEGKIEIDYDDPTRRTLDVTIVDTETRLFTDMEQLLDPFIMKIGPEAGFRYPDDTEEVVPVGEFYTTDVLLKESGAAPRWQLSSFDVSVRCQSDFANPYYVPNGTRVDLAVARMLQLQWPNMVFRLPATNWTTPALILREDSVPWTEARKLMATVGADLAISRDGICEALTRVSAARPPAAWEFIEGVNADFWEPQRKVTNDDFPNVIKVIGSNSTAAGVSAIAADMDPQSRTYRYGPYGEHVKVIRSEQVVNSNQAAEMAGYWLARLLGPQDEVTFNASPNAALDVGDVVSVTRERMGLHRALMIVSHISLPLTVGNSMTVTCRRSVFSDTAGTPAIEPIADLCDDYAGTWTQVIKTIDESDSSTHVMQDDDELFFTTVAGTVYQFGAWIKYFGPATFGELQFAFGEDTVVRGVWSGVTFNTASTPQPYDVGGKTATSSTALAGTKLSGADGGVLIHGTHVGNGGTFKLSWAKGGSSGSPVIVRAGSILEYRAMT